MSYVELDGVTKKYGEVFAADHVCLAIEEGELFSLVGPSGSGKTTILRLIAGFTEPTAGKIYIGDKMVNELPVYKRDIGMVFQNYALFPHMTVYENIAFGLRVRRLSPAEIEKRVQEMLELVRLPGLEKRRVQQLSGGQQQRVALARALVTRPRVLLLDEPLGALDKKLRMIMQVELRQIQKEVGITTFFVTHDQEEALTLSDRIAVINEGKIVQQGPPAEVYEHPSTRFVADFLGQSNFFEGRVVDLTRDEVVVSTPTGLTIRGQPGRVYSIGQPITVAVRPEKIGLSTERLPYANLFEGQVEHQVYLGTSITYHVRLREGTSVLAFEKNEAAKIVFPVGSPVFLGWDKECSLLLAH
ncbi:MAG: ABC transporter ATP-binding protein [Anaerolineae bacterium]